jgi:hypothetical protein
VGLFVRSLLESLDTCSLSLGPHQAPPTLNRRFGSWKVSSLRTHYHLHLHPLVSAPTLTAYLTSESNNTLDLYTLPAGRKGHADNHLSANRIATAEYSAPEANVSLHDTNILLLEILECYINPLRFVSSRVSKPSTTTTGVYIWRAMQLMDELERRQQVVNHAPPIPPKMPNTTVIVCPNICAHVPSMQFVNLD